MVQTTALVSGEYLQLPAVVLNLGESASTGTGTMISTLLAVERRLNWLFACTSHICTDAICPLVQSNQIRSNDGFVVCSIQRKQRPAAHYNNKIHIDKSVSSLMFTVKCTAA